MNEEQKTLTPDRVEKKSLRPVLIISERTVSVYPTLLEHLLAGLADESIPVALVCRPGCEVGFVVPPAVEVIRHPAINLPLMGRRNSEILVERLGDFKPTVLHCLCESKGRVTRQLAQQLDLPYVLTVNSLQKRWRQFFISSRHLATLIVPAKSIADNLAAVYSRFAERIKQINIGTFVRKQGGCFRESGRLACMVTAHPLGDESEFENLFGAVKHLAVDGYEFMVVVMGGGRGEKGLRKLLAALGLLQVVTIVPRLAAWRSVLATGDIFVRPRPSAAFDPFLLEAMSAGAAVAGCKGGVDDLIIEDKTGVTFDPDDELSIYNVLQRLLNTRESARRLATGAQEYLRKNHSVSEMVSSTVQTYRNAEQWYGR